MKKMILAIFLLIFFFIPSVSNAQTPPINEYERGKVTKIIKQGTQKIIDKNQPFQLVEIKLLTGGEKNKTIKVEHGSNTTIREYQMVKVGDEVVLVKLGTDKNSEYFIQDKFRFNNILIIFAGFFGLVVLFSRTKGALSFVGMLASLFVLLTFIVPSIARGADPVLFTLIGSVLIVVPSIFLSHGLNKRTTIAVVSTIITLVIAVGLSYLFANFTFLTGSGSEEAYSLQFGQFANINLKGLLLAGIIIGTLGVLDDITTAQSAVVDELKKSNPKLNSTELYKRGISVGKEHISSLVNTLILAYAGTSLPLFIFFTVATNTQPVWVILNSELISEEIIRAIVGSTALVLAVPITTFLAAMIYGEFEEKKAD